MPNAVDRTALNGEPSSIGAHAFVFGSSEGLRLGSVFVGSSAPNRSRRASAQININVIQIAHRILVVRESWHHEVVAVQEVLPSADDDSEKLSVAHCLQ